MNPNNPEVDDLVPDTANAGKDNDASAEAVCPKDLKEKSLRDKLGRKIAEAIKSGEDEKGDLKQRISLNEKLVQNRNIDPERKPWAGAQSFHIPLSGPRLSQRKANLTGTITSQDPVFRLTKLGSRERVEAAEQTLQFFLDIVGWKETLDIAAQIAMETNTPIWRVTYQEYPRGYYAASHTGPFAGIVFDVIHPDYFVCYPANQGGIPMSRVCGHCFDNRRAVITQRQKTGEYFQDVEVKGEDDSIRKMHGNIGTNKDLQSLENKRQEEADSNIKLWDCIYRDDLDEDGIEELYRVIIRAGDGHGDILRIEPYTGNYHWYVDMPIKREWGKFWTEGSPAQDVQGLQLLLNSMVNEFIWGVQMSARPPIITQNWQLNDSLVGYAPGEYRNVRNLGQAMPVPTKFNPQGFDFLIQIIRGFADSVTKTSDSLTGAPSNAREATATEQNIKYQAFQIGSSDDVTAITPALRRLVMVTLDTLAANFAEWYPVYQDAVAITSADELTDSYTINLAGKSPEDAPQMQSQQAQMLLQLAQSFPQAGIPLNELIKSIILATSLPNKEDILRAVEGVQPGSDGQMPNVQLSDLMQMLHQQGGPGAQPGQQAPGGPGGLDLGALLQIAGNGGASALVGGAGGAGQAPNPHDVPLPGGGANPAPPRAA